MVSFSAVNEAGHYAATGVTLRGPGALCTDIHPGGLLGLGAAWLLADGTASHRASHPSVLAALERVRALETESIKLKHTQE